MEHMLMITDLMLDTVLHLPHMSPQHQNTVPQPLAMMPLYLTEVQGWVMKKRPYPTSHLSSSQCSLWLAFHFSSLKLFVLQLAQEALLHVGEKSAMLMVSSCSCSLFQHAHATIMG